MRRARVSLLVGFVLLGVAGCGGDSSEGRTDGSGAAVTSSASDDASGAEAADTTTPATIAETVAPVTTDDASPTTEPAPDTTTPATEPDAEGDVDPAAVARVQSIVVQADDLPADQGWVQEDDDSFEPASSGTDQPEGCLDQAFDQAGVADDARSTSVDTGFGRDDVSYLTFGASQSDELPDLEQLAEAVVACDGVTDADGTNLIVVRQPDFEIVDPSVSFLVNVDQDGFLFNALFVLAQRDDVTVLSSSTAIVGSAELEIELVLEMLEVMLERV